MLAANPRACSHDNASVGCGSIPVEGEAGLGEEGRAEGEDGRTGDVGALVEQVVEDDGGGPARAEVVAREEVELEEAVEGVGVGAVVPGVAASAGGGEGGGAVRG